MEHKKKELGITSIIILVMIAGLLIIVCKYSEHIKNLTY